MRHSCWARQLAFVAIAVAVFMIGNDSCLAAGGGSWGGSWGGGSGSMGSGGSLGSGGSWGSNGGFRTPVRNFFAYRQPVRSLFRGFHSRGSVGGSASTGSAGTGFASTGFGSGGSVGAGSSGGFGSTGFQYYSSTGNSTGGSTGFVSAPTANWGTGASADCNDCFGGIQSGSISTSPIPYPYSETGFLGSDGSMIGNSTIVPGTQYYDSSGSAIPTPGSPTESGNVRGFEKPPTPEPAKDGDTTSMSPLKHKDGAAILNVDVPIDAKVLINNRLTATTGQSRSYVSRHLQNGRDYPFVVEATVQRNGRDITLQKKVVMQAGLEQSVNFDFDHPVLTQVTIKVPENADIRLCGNETSVTGSVRNFKTRLMPGQVWENYDIDVSYEEDGRMVTKKQTITIKAGQKYVVDFASGKDVYVSM